MNSVTERVITWLGAEFKPEDFGEILQARDVDFIAGLLLALESCSQDYIIDDILEVDWSAIHKYVTKEYRNGI